MSNSDRKTYVLYHANCADGFGAAWVAQLVFGDQASYLPVSYGRPVPEIAEGSDVYLLDFSYPLAELEALAARMHAVLIIDHHASAREDLMKLARTDAKTLSPILERGNVRVVFDTSRSGAALTWRVCFPEEPMAELVRYIEDRDLWAWQIPESREVSAGLASYPFSFALWNELAKDIPRLKAEGKVALRMIDEQARRQAGQAALVTIGGYAVPIVNCTCYVSETCEQMLQLYTHARFVAASRDEPDRRVVSLRSRPDFDCSRIAKLYGGGGHPQACGYEIRGMRGVDQILHERLRHYELGWKPEHDDQHEDGSLAQAGACYALAASEISLLQLKALPEHFRCPEWPWPPNEWKPSSDPIRNLEKAGALIAAEIDRLLRRKGVA